VALIGTVVLVTNSTVTVTTTVSEQTTGISTDWITAFSSLVMMIATMFLAIYAYVTIDEGKKARTLDMCEKQLVNLFNPMAHILSRTLEYIPEDISLGKYQMLLEGDVEELREMFVKYGHYLTGSHYQSIDSLLFFDQKRASITTLRDFGSYLVFPYDQATAEICGLDKHANWMECFAAIDVRRKQLIVECIRLQRGWRLANIPERVAQYYIRKKANEPRVET
jgi:hypothetical protein